MSLGGAIVEPPLTLTAEDRPLSRSTVRPGQVAGQRSVKLALDHETGEVLNADDLSQMEEAAFSALRREAMENRNHRRDRKVTQARLTCVACRGALYVSRQCRSEGNRWFVHDILDPTCPFSSGHRISEDIHRALIYRGQQEGREHQHIKAFLARYIERDPLAQDVRQEAVTFGQVLKGEWKRPDVRCEIEGRRVVFEIQLSYTFLSEIIKRDEFYRNEGIYIIWVFRSLDLRRSFVIDEAFFNRRNVFVLDEEAIGRTEETGRLTFTGFFQRPRIEDGKVVDAWESMPISLRDVKFPSDGTRAYFFDYDSHKRLLEAELNRQFIEQDWDKRRASFLAAALDYHQNDCDQAYRNALDETIRNLEESSQWHRGFEPLKDDDFLGWHGILAVLLSLRQDRPIGYQYSVTYQVLEAALRQTSRDKRHPYAVIYIWAYKAFKPKMIDKHRLWVHDRAKQIQKSIENREATYLRSQRYDEAIAMLLPEMSQHLT